MMKFKIKTAPPKGRGSWAPDLASKVQDGCDQVCKGRQGYERSLRPRELCSGRVPFYCVKT